MRLENYQGWKGENRRETYNRGLDLGAVPKSLGTKVAGSGFERGAERTFGLTVTLIPT
jgi:hypothetical protein